jgi:hypothetical protein
VLDDPRCARAQTSTLLTSFERVNQ